ncbi:hypothetical protein PsunGV_gp004 [Pseudalatia unipuncta granulovirus]|uniref:Uncharacterized protein n=1 Tax=Pseudalatia unipuncta granulosis virus TaxID=36355 RepID=B6S6M3_GVPU|nr:hypothetical protein PsunGV_gp004 [Pseudalatia unipuncta granulovirus]ACH69354.1 unknown [Pseudalatia unipuncta granulovirus]
MDWFEIIFDRGERLQVIDDKYNNKIKIKSTTTRTIYNLPQSYLYEALYLDFLKNIGMYECVKYTRMIHALMVCYVTEIKWPDMDVIREHDMFVSHWAPLRHTEKLQAFIPDKSNKLRYIIKHQREFPIFMFVYDTEEERFRDEKLISIGTKRRKNNQPLCTKKSKMEDASTSKLQRTAGTQTCMLECYSILNKPLNVYKSLITREIHGNINQTSVIMSLPQCAMTEQQDITKRYSPQENMKAISRIYNKIDNKDELDLYDMYNRCSRCFRMFPHETILSQCYNCQIDEATL